MKFGIMAGGSGSRLVEEGVMIAKPLVTVGGYPLIERLIRIFERSCADSISVFLNEDMNEVIKYLHNLKETLSCPLNILEGRSPDSFQSFKRLVGFMDPTDKYVVTTVDTVFKEQKFLEMVNSFENMPVNLDGLLGATLFVDDEKPLYIEVDKADNVVCGFSDKKPTGKFYISAGIYALTVKSLPIIEEAAGMGITRLRNFQRMMIDKGLNLRAFDLGVVVDVDHQEDIEKGNRLLETVHTSK